MDDVTGHSEVDASEPVNRRRERRGRRAVVLSPRELPAELQRQIRGEVVSSGLKARVIFSRHDLGSLGINYSTFRRYVARLRQEAPPKRLSPTKMARIEVVARSLVTFFEVSFTPKAAAGVVAALALDRLGKIPAAAVGQKVPARAVSLARRVEHFLALAFDRAEVDRIVLALCR